MKMRSYSVLLSFALGTIIYFPGCREYKTTTKINSDGSCERTVILKGDSSEIANPASLPFPIPVNSSWKIERKKDTSEKNKFYYIAVKNFDNVDALNNEYKNSEKIGINVQFEKKFRWFFTYYNYEETYKAYFPFRIIPLKSFLTPKEYEMYLNDDTTKAFKKRVDEYEGENYIEYFFNVIVSAAESHKLKDINRDILLSKKEYFKNNIDKEVKDKTTVLHFLEKTYGIKSFRDISAEIEKAFDNIVEKMDLFGNASGSYENIVTMPGIILTTNSKSITGNTAAWKVDAKRFCYEDFTMTVQSRVINVWTFVVSGALVIAVIVLLILPKIKRK